MRILKRESHHNNIAEMDTDGYKIELIDKIGLGHNEIPSVIAIGEQVIEVFHNGSNIIEIHNFVAMVNEEFIEFVRQHKDDDTSRLILGRDKYPGIDVAMAAECISSRRKLTSKCPKWAQDNIVCPLELSSEQCSSEQTAGYKADLIKGCSRVADLTSGLGVDCAAFATVADKVLYNDMNPVLSDAARHNFTVLGIKNIEISNIEITQETIVDIINDFKPNLVFMDPARRSTAGEKVFRLKDCSPNVLELLPVLNSKGIRTMLKISPMADITQISRETGETLSRIHIIGHLGECKELLLEIEPGHTGEPLIIKGDIAFHPCDEQNAAAVFIESLPTPGQYLFEPDKALMKASCRNLLCQKFGIRKISHDVHIYVCDKPIDELSSHGRFSRILELMPFDKRSIRVIAEKYPHSELLSRGLPLSTDELRSKMKLASGQDARIYAVHCHGAGNQFIVTR